MSTTLASITGGPGARPWCSPSPRHLVLTLDTKAPVEFLDVTDRVRAFAAAAGVDTGLVSIQSLHTTVAVVVNEAEPLLLTDFVRSLERWAPADEAYAHDDPRRRTVNLQPSERVNGHAHCRALTLGATVVLTIVEGELLLGRWQRVFVVELDGPQRRRVALTAIGGRS